MTATLAGHVRILRLSHWVKNVFVLPGTVVALSFDPSRLSVDLIPRLILGLLAVGLVSSSNYVLNEILDAPFDRAHPTKKSRPVPNGQVSIKTAYLQWLVFGLAGIALGWTVSRALSAVLAAFWFMGCAYNVPPLRLKDVPYVDVLAEGINNPLRLLAGWYLTGLQAKPVTSLLIAYWMAGCYFMAVKRLAEYRMFGGSAGCAAYRRSLAWYTEPRLLVSVVFYASAAMLFCGAFLMRYHLELVLSFPFVAYLMAKYLDLAFDPDSAAQRPEKLYREPGLMAAAGICAIAFVVFLFAEIPLLHELFVPTEHP